MRRIAMFVTSLFLGLSALFITTGTAAADCPWQTPCSVATTD